MVAAIVASWSAAWAIAAFAVEGTCRVVVGRASASTTAAACIQAALGVLADT